MVKSKVFCVLILAAFVVLGTFVLASAQEKALNLGPSTMNAEQVPTHVESYVPVVGEGQGDDPIMLQDELDKMNGLNEKINAPFMIRDGITDLSARVMLRTNSKGDKTTLFEDDFQSYTPTTPSTPFPAPWTRVTTVTGYTWFVATAQSGGVPNGTQAALVNYGPAGSPQDEWLISPLIDVSGVTGNLFIDFEYLHDNTNWPFDLDLYVSTTGTSTGDFTLVWAAMDQTHANMVWSLATVDLTAYTGGNLYIAFRYQGEDANLGGIDNIIVYDETVLPGRCCYGTPAAPSCSDEFEADCIARPDFISFDQDLTCATDPCPIPNLGRCCYGDPFAPSCADEYQFQCEARTDMISWTEGIDCTTACPISTAPANDECVNAIDVTGTYPVVVEGTTINATEDCPEVFTAWNGVWYKFDVPYENFNVNIDFCNTPTEIYSIGAVLHHSCVCDDYTLYTSGAFADCGDGYDTPSINWNGMTGPTTLYYLVAMTDADDLPAPMDFHFTISVEEIIPPENDLCSDAIYITEGTYTANTAMASTDESGYAGQNIWYVYTPSATGIANFSLCGSDFDTKMAVYDGYTCSPLPTQLAYDDDDCPTNTASLIEGIPVVYGNEYLVEVGGYSTYTGNTELVIDLVIGGACCDPATGECNNTLDEATCLAMYGGTGIYNAGEDCASFTCIIVTPGDNCSDPYVVTLGLSDLPYTNAGQYTCDRGNDYVGADMCYGNYYGNGEDMVYQFTFTEDMTIEFTMDPHGTTWTYLELREDCPPSGGSSGACVFYMRNTGSGVYSSGPVTVLAGTYYGIVDTWPSPDCIPEFDLTIAASVPPEGRCCYGYPQGSLCDDVIELDCIALGGAWDGTKTCSANPCIIASPGDNCEDPYVVKLPDDMNSGPDNNQFINLNYTCDRGNDYAATCLGSYDGGEDIIYALDVDAPMVVDIILTTASTWTGMAVSAMCPGATCIAYITGSSSNKTLANVSLPAGISYLMIDTYPAPNCIDEFTLTIKQPCNVVCPPGSTPEGEACIPNNGDDVTNGGCNMDVPVFGSVSCGETICGLTNTYLYGTSNYRDTDWYLLHLDEWSIVTLTGQAEAAFILGFIEQIVPGVAGCDNITGYLGDYVSVAACTDAIVTVTLAPGDYYIFASLSVYTGFACPGVEYYFSVACETTEPVYCAASGGCDEYIEQVTIGSINNVTTCTEYGDYTGMSTEVLPGEGYAITVVNGYGYSSDYCIGWVDWNRDYVFGETEVVNFTGNPGVGPYTGTVTVPGDATEGPCRLRVRISYSTLPGPCGATSYGEVEDYTLNVGQAFIPITIDVTPDPLYALMAYAAPNPDPPVAYAYLGSDFEPGYDVNDIDLGTVTVNGLTPMATEIIPSYPEFLGEVLKITVSLNDFAESYGVLYNTTTQNYTIAGSFTDAVTFTEVGELSFIGHTLGDVNGDQTLNLLDILLLLGHIYSGGDAPIAGIATGDTDCSGEMNLLDVLVLISTIYQGGDKPNCIPPIQQ